MMIGMIEAEEIKTMHKKVLMKAGPDSLEMPIYRTKAADEIASSVVCPHCVDEVYSLGISLQNYIGTIYRDSAMVNKGVNKNLFTDLALNQLGIKNKIEKIARCNLDRLLMYFYDNGGPIIEAPVCEESAKEIQPFFDRIVANFLDQVEFLVNKTYKEEMTANSLNTEINNHITSMYIAMGKLFQADEIKNAFSELISIREV
jgi:hypothetical protein